METINPTKLQGYRAQFPFDSEKETMDLVNEQLLAAFGLPSAPDQTGIYLISSNAGFYSSVAFWKEVLDKGPGLANPERFPWTLANAPCGAMARAFGITGPNYTFNGSADDLPAILQQIEFDFEQQIIGQAWLIAIDFAENAENFTQLSAVVFFDESEITSVLAHIALAEPPGELQASVFLQNIV